MRGSALARLVAVSTLLVVLGSCLSGSGAVRTEAVATATPSPQTPPPPPPDPSPTEPPATEPPPTALPVTCIPTHEGACLPEADFRTEAEALAEEYRGHTDFANQWGLGHINAHYAYGHLTLLKGEGAAPGAGITIGFIDTGIDQDHPDFAGKTITEQFLQNAADETGTGFSHGTAVASVAAGAGSAHELSAQGVAWAADIAMFAVPTGAGPEVHTPVTLAVLDITDDVWAGWLNHIFAWQDGTRTVAILNLSVGYEGIIDSYSEQELRANFDAAIAAMAQADVTDRTILVWAAGNAHGDPCDPATTEQCVDNEVDAVSVQVLPGLVARIPELQGHSIAVVALRADGQIADFSNRCGIAAHHCIAAPGEDVRIAYFGPADGNPSRGYANARGTSFAAPFVAGGLAVMKQLFRDQLSSPELVTRLLETANDEGTYADQTIYGRGAMDLRAATWPVGVLDVPVGSPADGRAASLLATRLRTGEAFGDGPDRALAGREIAAFDALGAPFWFDLGDFTAVAAARRMTAESRDFVAPMSGWRVSLGHLALAERALALTLGDRRTLTGTAFTTGGGRQRPPAAGATLSWRPPEAPLGLLVGWMHEPETVLGSSAGGAFGRLSAETAFAGIEADVEVGGWRMGVGAEVGAAYPQVRHGIITGISPLTTSAFTFHASRSLAADGTLRFSVSQPLRVDQGRASLSVPAGRTKAGAVLRSPVSAELAPSGRQLDIAAQWQQPLAFGELRLGVLLTHHPGHRAAADPALTLLSGWHWSY